MQCVCRSCDFIHIYILYNFFCQCFYIITEMSPFCNFSATFLPHHNFVYLSTWWDFIRSWSFSNIYVLTHFSVFYRRVDLSIGSFVQHTNRQKFPQSDSDYGCQQCRFPWLLMGQIREQLWCHVVKSRPVIGILLTCNYSSWMEHSLVRVP